MASITKYIRVTNSANAGASVNLDPSGTTATPTAAVYGGTGTATPNVVNASAGIISVAYDPVVGGNAKVVVNVDSTGILGLYAGDQYREVDFTIENASQVGIGGTLFTPANAANEAAAFELSLNQTSGLPQVNVPPGQLSDLIDLVSGYPLAVVIGGIPAQVAGVYNAKPYYQQIGLTVFFADDEWYASATLGDTADAVAYSPTLLGQWTLLPSPPGGNWYNVTSVPLPTDAAAAISNATPSLVAAVWSYLTSSADALAATTIGKWLRTSVNSLDSLIQYVSGSSGPQQFTAQALTLAPAADVVLNVTPGNPGSANVGNTTSGALQAYQNSLYTVTFPVVDQSGNPINLSGVSALVMAFADPNNPSSTAFTATIGGAHASVSVGGSSNDMVTLTLDATITATIANLEWILGNDTTKQIYANGTFRVSPFPSW